MFTVPNVGFALLAVDSCRNGEPNVYLLDVSCLCAFKRLENEKMAAREFVSRVLSFASVDDEWVIIYLCTAIARRLNCDLPGCQSGRTALR